MSDELPDIDNLNEARRKALAETAHPVTLDELKQLGEKLFPYPTHPFYKQYFQFLKDHPHGKFHRASTNDKVEIIYCHDQNKGLWFLPGGGTGPLQEAGLKLMKEIVEKRSR